MVPVLPKGSLQRTVMIPMVTWRLRAVCLRLEPAGRSPKDFVKNAASGSVRGVGEVLRVQQAPGPPMLLVHRPHLGYQGLGR